MYLRFLFVSNIEPQKEAGVAARERARTGLERVTHEPLDCEAFLTM